MDSDQITTKHDVIPTPSPFKTVDEIIKHYERNIPMEIRTNEATCSYILDFFYDQLLYVLQQNATEPSVHDLYIIKKINVIINDVRSQYQQIKYCYLILNAYENRKKSICHQ